MASLTPQYMLNTGGHAPTYRERKPIGWTSLYHSDYLLASTESYEIWYLLRRHLDVWSAGFPTMGTAKVEYTGLISARVIATVIAGVWPSTAKLFLNGTMIRDYNFNLGGGSVTDIIDVTNLIFIGRNEFSFVIEKVPWVGWGDYLLTVDLVIDAESSNVEPPPPWDTWPTWWPFAAGGLGLAAAGGIILMKKRKR